MNTRYELNMDVPPREAIRLMYVSKSRFGGDWNSVPHTHSCTEVFYCVDGRGQFNVEGKMLDVAPDDMVIVNPRTLHTELSYQPVRSSISCSASRGLRSFSTSGIRATRWSSAVPCARICSA